MLLNIDKPHRTCRVHSDECVHIPRPHGTSLKPIEELGRDGGWFAVSSTDQAKAIAQREFPAGALHICSRCMAP